MIRKSGISASAFKGGKKRKVDMVTGLYQTDITRFWNAANRDRLPAPRFSMAQLAAEMRRRAHQVTPAGTLWRCEYCLNLLAGAQISYDHKDPVSLGGPNTIANLAICCETCNREKGGMTATDYALYMALLDGKLGVKQDGKFVPVALSGGGAANIRARLRAKPTWGGRRG